MVLNGKQLSMSELSILYNNHLPEKRDLEEKMAWLCLCKYVESQAIFNEKQHCTLLLKNYEGKRAKISMYLCTIRGSKYILRSTT